MNYKKNLETEDRKPGEDTAVRKKESSVLLRSGMKIRTERISIAQRMLITF